MKYSNVVSLADWLGKVIIVILFGIENVVRGR